MTKHMTEMKGKGLVLDNSFKACSPSWLKGHGKAVDTTGCEEAEKQVLWSSVGILFHLLNFPGPPI